MRHTDEGSAVLAVVATLSISAVILTGLARTATTATDAARARAAADAAALAGAAGTPDDARRVASANGATVVSYADSASGVVITVTVGRATASARASMMHT